MQECGSTPKKNLRHPVRRYGVSIDTPKQFYVWEHIELQRDYVCTHIDEKGAVTMKVRVTMNNARKGQNGIFLAKHSDGEQGKAAQMGGLLTKWSCAADQSTPFEKVEADFYEEHFRAGLDCQNAKHKKAGHKKRIKTMDEYRENINYCPECTLFYLGDKDGHVDARVLLACVAEFLNWREKHFPLVRSLDFALHVEDGAPHIHERHVWIGHDEQGNEVAEQGKALAEMGVLPPDPSAEITRANNPKMTYTAICREKLQEIATAHGVELMTEPREKGKQGRTQARYITEKLKEEARQARHETVRARNELFTIREQLSKDEKRIISNENVIFEQRQVANELQREVEQLEAKKEYMLRGVEDIEEYKAFARHRQQEREEQEAREKAKREAEEARKAREAAEAAARKEQERQAAEQARQAAEAAARKEQERQAAEIARETTKAPAPALSVPIPAKGQRDAFSKLSETAESAKLQAMDENGELTEETKQLFARLGL